MHGDPLPATNGHAPVPRRRVRRAGPRRATVAAVGGALTVAALIGAGAGPARRTRRRGTGAWPLVAGRGSPCMVSS